MRRAGIITEDIEKNLIELVDSHNLQWGEILFLIYGWLMIHRPDAQEIYEDGENPVFYYGPKKEVNE